MACTRRRRGLNNAAAASVAAATATGVWIPNTWVVSNTTCPLWFVLVLVLANGTRAISRLRLNTAA